MGDVMASAVEIGMECVLIGLEPDGTPILLTPFGKRRLPLHGLEIPQPPPDLYVQILTARIPRLPRPPRYVVRRLPTGGESVQLFVHGWQDKSGEVWQDIAPVLLQQGVARVADGDFPERQEYLRLEKET
jgi:hypothetical protein